MGSSPATGATPPNPPLPRGGTGRGPIEPRGVEPILVCDENRFAHGALERLGQEGARRATAAGARLVHIDGPAGVGKSHLVRQFVRDERRADRTLKVSALTASEFAAQFADASAAKSIDKFQARYRALDLLVVEDLAALEGQREAQQQLVAVVDEVLSQGGRVVLTSRKPPGELRGVTARLVNRCHGGTCASIEPPGEPSRKGLLEHFARTRQIPLGAETIAFLASELPVSPRELLAAVVQLEASARLERLPLDVRLARRWLGGDARPRAATLQQVAEAVARHFGVTLSGLRADTRLQGVVLPRQCAMFLSRELTEKPLGDIARFFGRRNHSTVVHACRRIQSALDGDPALRQHLVQIRHSVGGARPRHRA